MDDADFAEFPWVVAILDDGIGRTICGGSLIHPKVVLTTFHNVESYEFFHNALNCICCRWPLDVIHFLLSDTD